MCTFIDNRSEFDFLLEILIIIDDSLPVPSNKSSIVLTSDLFAFCNLSFSAIQDAIFKLWSSIDFTPHSSAHNVSVYSNSALNRTVAVLKTQCRKSMISLSELLLWSTTDLNPLNTEHIDSTHNITSCDPTEAILKAQCSRVRVTLSALLFLIKALSGSEHLIDASSSNVGEHKDLSNMTLELHQYLAELAIKGKQGKLNKQLIVTQLADALDKHRKDFTHEAYARLK